MDYEQHFGFRDNPFKAAHDSDYFYLSAGVREALAGLRLALTEGHSHIWLQAEPGAGRSFLLRRLPEALKRQVKAAVIFNPNLAFGEILALAIKDLGGLDSVDLMSPEEVLLGLFQNAAAEAAEEEGLATILLIDEAHLLPRETLLELHYLTQLEAGSKKRFHLLLSSPAGQDPFRPLKIGPEAALQPAVIRLASLTLAETEDYLNFRLRTAGGQKARFSPGAVGAIFESGRGQPRLINQLAARALMSAWAEGKLEVGPGHIRMALDSLKNPPEFKAIKPELYESRQWLTDKERDRQRRSGRALRLLAAVGGLAVLLALGAWYFIRLDWPGDMANAQDGQISEAPAPTATPAGAPELGGGNLALAAPPSQVVSLPLNNWVLVIENGGKTGRLWRGGRPVAGQKMVLTALDFDYPGLYVMGRPAKNYQLVNYPAAGRASRADGLKVWNQAADILPQSWLPVMVLPKAAEPYTLGPAMEKIMRENLQLWREAQENKLADTLAALYFPAFDLFESGQPPRSIIRDNYLANLKAEYLEAGEVKLTVSEPMILVDPLNGDLVWTIFHLQHESRLRREMGLKVLIFNRNSSYRPTKWQIAGELWWPERTPAVK